MNVEATALDFASWIGETLRMELEEKDGICTFSFKGAKERYLELSEVEAILKRLSVKQEHEDTVIYDDCSYETLVREESPFLHSGLTSKEFELKDKDNDIIYILARPSDEYMLFLLYKISKIASPRDLPIFIHRIRRSLEHDNRGILEIFRESSSLFLTLRVESGRKRTVNDFIKYANSFFFQLSYNLDSAFVPQRYLDELLRTVRIKRVRRIKFDDLEAPKRFYVSDLIYHYQLAVASDSPSLEYLSYYHIAEHFFDDVFNAALVEQVKSMITQPDFSYKRKKDIERLIREIHKSLKLRGEGRPFSEGEALELTLDEYVDVKVLSEKVRAYDDSLIEYYRTNQVPFSNGDCVNLESSDTSQVLGAIARRIYKTRNAIVHSKEGDKGKYIPFKHDKILVKEIPILRFIAELIIIGSSAFIS